MLVVFKEAKSVLLIVEGRVESPNTPDDVSSLCSPFDSNAAMRGQDQGLSHGASRAGVPQQDGGRRHGQGPEKSVMRCADPRGTRPSGSLPQGLGGARGLLGL